MPIWLLKRAGRTLDVRRSISPTLLRVQGLGPLIRPEVGLFKVFAPAHHLEPASASESEMMLKQPYYFNLRHRHRASTE